MHGTVLIGAVCLTGRGIITFEGFCGSRGMVFVWVKLQCKFPVGFFQVLIISILANSQYFIVVLACFYPEGNGEEKKTTTSVSSTVTGEYKAMTFIL